MMMICTMKEVKVILFNALVILCLVICVWFCFIDQDVVWVEECDDEIAKIIKERERVILGVVEHFLEIGLNL